MILTTSRKPSRKTRTLAKAIARFMNWRYITRGKMSLEEVFTLLQNENLAIIEEIKGNPAILKIVHPTGRELLSIRFNVSNIKKTKMDDSPVVFVGKPPFDPAILGAIPLSKAGMKFARKIDSKKKVYVRRKGGWIILDFTYDGECIFRLKMYES
jgi:U3 small nucleolar ribonucleoprotein protein IMP4